MFYVYMYRDPRPTKARQPVYVGKGSGRRSEMHWLHGNKVNKIFDAWLNVIRQLGLEPIIEIVAEFESEAEAFAKECELIALFGRKNTRTGSLCNCTDGGEGGSGQVMTIETKARMSQSALSRKSDVYQSEEFRAKIGRNSERSWKTATYREKTVTAMRSAQAMPEVFAKNSVATAAGWANETTRAKRIAGIKASRTPELRAQIGASCKALWTDEKRLEQSEKMRRVLDTPELKAKQSAATKARWADPATRPCNNLRPVVVTFPDGSQREFRSVSSLEPELGVSFGAATSSLKRGAPLKRGRFKGWSIAYKSLDTQKQQ